jgi:hypothetical protein
MTEPRLKEIERRYVALDPLAYYQGEDSYSGFELIAEVHRLRAELEQEERLHRCTALSLQSANRDHIQEREARLKEQDLRLQVVAENQRLREFIAARIPHTDDCPFDAAGTLCSCGLHDALRYWP